MPDELVNVDRFRLVNFLLDTNAVSETRKSRPNSEFMIWVEAQEPASLFLTTVTIGEAWLAFTVCRRTMPIMQASKGSFTICQRHTAY